MIRFIFSIVSIMLALSIMNILIQNWIWVIYFSYVGLIWNIKNYWYFNIIFSCVHTFPIIRKKEEKALIWRMVCEIKGNLEPKGIMQYHRNLWMKLKRYFNIFFSFIMGFFQFSKTPLLVKYKCTYLSREEPNTLLLMFSFV